MAKTQHRIGLVQADPDEPARSPERDALAVAISDHAALTAALVKNKTNAQRTEDAFWTVNHAVEAAKAALEEAKAADAESIASGKPGTAVKSARLNLQDLEDQLDATRRAKTFLQEQHADLTTRLGFADSKLKSAVTAVIHKCPQMLELIETFRSTQLAYHDMRQGMRALVAHFPDVSNNSWWQTSGLAGYVRFWDAPNWEQDLPPSATAAKVQQWSAALHQNADAVLG